MKFFTDKTVKNDYLLIKIGDYLKMPQGNWKEIFIDPGVYELTKQSWYSWEKWVDIGLFLDGLPSHCYFSADYPCDMNEKYTIKFLDKSWTNAIKYCYHPRYIVTVQSRFKDYYSFTRWFDKYNKLNIESGIMGLGNICRIHHLDEYIKYALDYAFKNCNHPRIHIYGLGMRLIPYANCLAEVFGIELSMDSTKWTRCFHTAGLPSCRKHNRQQYFDDYIQELRNRGITVK